MTVNTPIFLIFFQALALVGPGSWGGVMRVVDGDVGVIIVHEDVVINVEVIVQS